jgi:hypothetical protein
MGKIRKRTPVKLITGFIFKNQEYIIRTKKELQKKFGKIDFESQALPFIHTDYYNKEFGADLKRSFISFKRLINPENLPQIKIFTNKVEHKLSLGNKRRVNIDPGYLDLSKLILATTKDYKHRIYLNKGIFAEVTLFYQNGSFTPWDWTYPDYKSDTYIQIFNEIRKIYIQQIK